MDKVLYTDGVVASSTQLRFAEEQRQFHIQRRAVDSATSGRVSGLAVSIDGSDATLLDIAAGWGYTARGDYVELLDAYGPVALADPTLNVVNYVCLAYREVATTDAAYETSGTNRKTLTERSSVVVILSSDEYDALEASYDSGSLADNLADADINSTYTHDRLVVIAVVTGKGFGEDFLEEDLTNGVIVQTALPATTLTASLASDGEITGINLKSLDGVNLGAGTGTIHAEVVSGDIEISWSAPGDAYGAVISSGVDFDWTDGFVSVQLESDTADLEITIEIFPQLLPRADDDYYTDVDISVFYSDTAPIFSAKDSEHRAKLGSYIPQEVNPHGLGHNDFAQQVAVLPKSLSLGTDLLGSDTEALAARITTPQITSGSQLTLLWTIPGGGSIYRVYAGYNDGGLMIASNAYYDGSDWLLDNTGNPATLTTFAYNSVNTLMAEDTVGAVTWKQVCSNTNESVPAAGLLSLGAGFGGSIVDRQRARLTMPFDGSLGESHKVLVQHTRGGSGYPDARTYVTPSSTQWVQNASYDADTGDWSRDHASYESWKLHLSYAGLSVQYKNAVSWADGTWTGIAVLTSDGMTVTGELTVSNDVEVGNDLTVTNDVAVGNNVDVLGAIGAVGVVASDTSFVGPNACKAKGVLSAGGASVPSISNAFNLSIGSQVQGTVNGDDRTTTAAYCEFTFDDEVPTPYSVFIQSDYNPTTYLLNPAGDNQTQWGLLHYFPVSKTSTGFRVYGIRMRDSGGVADPQDVTTVGPATRSSASGYLGLISVVVF